MPITASASNLTIARVFTPPMDDRTESLIARNHALLRRAAARPFAIVRCRWRCDGVASAGAAAWASHQNPIASGAAKIAGM